MKRSYPLKTVEVCMVAVLLVVLGLPNPAFAQQAPPESTTAAPEASEDKRGGNNEGVETRSADENSSHFGGPKSVGGTLKKDAEDKKPVLGKVEDAFQRVLKPYFDFKTKIKENYGLTFGLDYNALFQAATESPGEDSAAGGVVRFFGRWSLLGRDSGNTGTFVYKVENRHRLGTDIAPQDLGFEVGYAGLTATPFSDIGWALTNLFWEQQLWNNRVALVFGVVDTTDYVDTYSLVDPWSDFINLAFSTNPTIPAPNQGLGAAARAMVTDNFYVLGGLADTNGDPTDPWESFKSFFDEAEYFYHLEVGWIPSFERRFTDNIHLTGWYADTRKEAQVPSGWGLAFSWNRLFKDKWEPFVRAGYSDDGGALWKWSVSIGLGYHIREKSDLIALGLNWGQPSKEVFGPGLSDQYTAELFYRLRLLEIIDITPNVQLLVDPALNPEEDVIAIFGVRARLSF